MMILLIYHIFEVLPDWGLNFPTTGLSISFVALGILIVRCLFRRKRASSDLQSQSKSKSYNDESDPYRNQDSENGTVYFKIPLFSYKELEEATNNFHQANQLGSGGFGIVYYGKSFPFQTSFTVGA